MILQKIEKRRKMLEISSWKIGTDTERYIVSENPVTLVEPIKLEGTMLTQISWLVDSFISVSGIETY